MTQEYVWRIWLICGCLIICNEKHNIYMYMALNARTAVPKISIIQLAKLSEISLLESWKVNSSLGSSDAILLWRSWWILVRVMACWLRAPSHYLNQCWLVMSKVQWHSSEDIIMRRLYMALNARTAVPKISIIQLAKLSEISLLESWKVNSSLGSSDAILLWRSWWTLVRVMAWWLRAPSHYLNQCWLVMSKVQWHSSEDIIIKRFEDTNQ